jgi:hypothetical protein
MARFLLQGEHCFAKLDPSGRTAGFYLDQWTELNILDFKFHNFTHRSK